MQYENEQEEFIADPSIATAKYKAFIGSVVFENIIENLPTQFEDYINIEDKLSYVQTFFSQYEDSKKFWSNDETEEEPQTILQALDDYYLYPFLELLSRLFKERLNISITAIEDEKPITEETEILLISLYENLVLNARHNIRKVYVDYLYRGIMANIITEKYFKLVYEKPTVDFLTNSMYLKLIDPYLATEYENGSFTGNFLQKYSPKFYKNKDFYDEIIAEVMSKAKLFSELKGGDDI